MTEGPHQAASPVLRAEHISKSFGAVDALIDVSLDIYQGQSIGIVGDNGAGKSTLIKVLSGVFPPTSGTLYLDGEEVAFSSPAEARKRGVETVYQDLALVNELDVAGNFYLGREITAKGLLRILGHLRLKEMRQRAREAVDELHIKIPGIETKLVDRMSGGQRQAVAIARGVVFGRRLLLLDEPTSALGVEESGEVLRLLERMRGQAIPMLIISHNLQEVFSTCDRIIVLRLGRKVADLVTADTKGEEVVGYITGALQPTG